MFRQSLLRTTRSLPSSRVALGAVRSATTTAPTGGQAPAKEHPLSNPTLADIERRWEKMPPAEQAELWMALRDRMVVDWKEMSLQEKKASYYIAFGAHGPRAQTPPGEGWRVFGGTMAIIGISCVIFAILRFFAKGSPSTMNKEYQEATNEYLRKQNSEPISGLSSEGYVGAGQVQSAPRKK